MKIKDMLTRIAREDALPSKWKVEVAARWELSGATEPEESGGAKLSFEDYEGAWRYFADLDLDLSPNYGLSDYIDHLILDDDAPASVVLPFVEAFKHSALDITVRKPVSDIPF